MNKTESLKRSMRQRAISTWGSRTGEKSALYLYHRTIAYFFTGIFGWATIFLLSFAAKLIIEELYIAGLFTGTIAIMSAIYMMVEMHKLYRVASEYLGIHIGPFHGIPQRESNYVKWCEKHNIEPNKPRFTFAKTLDKE